MFSILRYGTDAAVRLDWPANTRLTECGTPEQPALADLPGAVASALAEPLDYPPLARSLTPMDRVVLALEEGLPKASQIVAAVIDCLIRSGIDPASVTVLRTPADQSRGVPDLCPLLPGSLREQLTLATHDPTSRGRLAYLASTQRGNPILLNRAIVDADVVLPIGRLCSREEVLYHGIHTAVFPTFSDQRTLVRFRTLEVRDSNRSRKRHWVQECDEVGWLLGLNFTIQVLPGPGDEVLDVLAGQFAAVRRRGAERYEAAWSWSVPARAGLVVAAIQGGVGQQTWQNLGRALAAAIPLVEDRGAIALCCELEAEPGPAVRQLAESPSRQQAMKRISAEGPEDAFVAAQLAAALDRAELYLLSRLDLALVEKLEIAPLQQPEQLAGLARRYQSCIVLANAPQAHVTVVEG
ncbi:MAG: lactate racemase domain-containing protein [Thermoguttaceae bacterium]